MLCSQPPAILMASSPAAPDSTPEAVEEPDQPALPLLFYSTSTDCAALAASASGAAANRLVEGKRQHACSQQSAKPLPHPAQHPGRSRMRLSHPIQQPCLEALATRMKIAFTHNLRLSDTEGKKPSLTRQRPSKPSRPPWPAMAARCRRSRSADRPRTWRPAWKRSPRPDLQHR